MTTDNPLLESAIRTGGNSQLTNTPMESVTVLTPRAQIRHEMQVLQKLLKSNEGVAAYWCDEDECEKHYEMPAETQAAIRDQIENCKITLRILRTERVVKK